MLTRLQVTGFKNLVDVDVRFGPFTCIAGPNGVGKSNLFDAIRFLSALADKPFVDAAKCVRDTPNRVSELITLFHQRDGKPVGRMRFVAEMIVPRYGIDALGLVVEARNTFLRYTLELGLVRSGPTQLGDRIELLAEELTYVKPADQHRALGFVLSSDWLKSVLGPPESVRRSPYISTAEDRIGERVVFMHPDGNIHRKTPRPARQLSRTLLSAVTSLESPTAALARQEMRAWQVLQLELSALRTPDTFDDPPQLGSDGSHLPATLYRLGFGREYGGLESVLQRLRQLNPDIKHLEIDRDEQRQLLALYATDGNAARLPARSLSDGTIRFLALTALLEDELRVGLLCFEEPENGIHPVRIPAVLNLLQDVAVDPTLPVAPGNPLRQVIVNTHSPLVLTGVPEDTLLAAVTEEVSTPSGLTRRVNFLPLKDTWRAQITASPRTIPLGVLVAYLNSPVAPPDPFTENSAEDSHARSARPKLVRERRDVQLIPSGHSGAA